MREYYCRRLFEDINFCVENIYICCGMSLSEGIPVPSCNENIDNYVKKLLKWRNTVYIKSKLGKISESCRNCLELKTQDVSFFKYINDLILCKKFSIKNIVIKSFRQCEYACLYCLEKKYTNGEKTQVPIKSKYYDFLPILKSLINNKMIDHDVQIEFQGGSISVLKEFDDILDLIEEYGVKSLLYHTNAYRFIPKIANLAKKIPSCMSISIDSGCRVTYKKIKTEDAFDVVIENIIKYANSNIDCTIKYIIVKNVNDNIDEIKKYCKTIEYIRSKLTNKDKVIVMLDCDFRDSLKENYVLPENYLVLFKFLSEYCNRNNISFGCQEFIRNLLKKQQVL